MTDEEWKSVEESLSHPYGKAHFKIDGYDVKAYVVPEKPLKFCIAVYVNDEMKMEWIIKESDIRQRFYNRTKRCLLNAEAKRKLKRERKSFREKILAESTYTAYTPFFDSFRSMKSVFTKNNDKIELAGCE